MKEQVLRSYYKIISKATQNFTSNLGSHSAVQEQTSRSFIWGITIGTICWTFWIYNMSQNKVSSSWDSIPKMFSRKCHHFWQIRAFSYWNYVCALKINSVLFLNGETNSVTKEESIWGLDCCIVNYFYTGKARWLLCRRQVLDGRRGLTMEMNMRVINFFHQTRDKIK